MHGHKPVSKRRYWPAKVHKNKNTNVQLSLLGALQISPSINPIFVGRNEHCSWQILLLTNNADHTKYCVTFLWSEDRFSFSAIDFLITFNDEILSSFLVAYSCQNIDNQRRSSKYIHFIFILTALVQWPKI